MPGGAGDVPAHAGQFESLTNDGFAAGFDGAGADEHAARDTALDVKISGKKQPHWSAGVIVGFYASVDAAQKVADEINGGAVDGWSEAVVVAAQPVTTKVAS